MLKKFRGPQSEDAAKAHSKNNKVFFIFVFFNFVLFCFNIFFILVLVRTTRSVANSCRSCNHETSDYRVMKSVKYERVRKVNNVRDDNLISLDFRILDIYRIDVSCNVVDSLNRSGLLQRGVNRSQLYEKIRIGSLGLGFKTMNRHKGCPKTIANWSRTDKVAINRKLVYEPMWNNETTYDPFKYNKVVDEELFGNIKDGGVFVPNCKEDDLENVFFIVSCSRNRRENLKEFLLNIHNYLQTAEHKFKYRVVVAEQWNNDTKFNKGRLYNTAVNWVLDYQKKHNETVDCIVLHDVDLIPSSHSSYLGERGDYRCRDMPWHLSRKVYLMNSEHDQIYYQFLTGGILSMRLEHFVNVNGFSNEYFGWGAEDVINFILVSIENSIHIRFF
jgi:hypothetical protein